MARSIKQIKDEMTEMFIKDVNIQTKYELEADETFEKQFSKVSLESILFYIVAFCAWTLETLFDKHLDDMEVLYREHHAHTFSWYNNKAKAFMLGYKLIRFTSNYDTTELSEAQIEEAKIITNASCIKRFNSNNTSFLRLKVAKQDGKMLKKLDEMELASFSSYMSEIQDAGVDLVCTSNEADYINMKWVVYYDPQVLDGEGNRLDGSASDVVKTAIRDYVQDLPFNGLYKLTYHIDVLQKVQGVVDAYIKEAFVHPELSSQYVSVTESGTIADAGYFKFYSDNDLIVEMIPFES